MKMQKLYFIIITILFTLTTYSNPYEFVTNKNLKTFIREFNALKNINIKTVEDLETIDGNMRAYIQNCTDTQQTAYAYYRIAKLYYCNIPFNMPLKIIKSIKQALSYPQPPEAEAYLYINQIATLMHNDFETNMPVVCETYILSNIFEGINCLLDDTFTNKFLKAPVVQMSSIQGGMTNNISWKESHENYKKKFNKRRRIIANNELVIFIESLIQSSFSLYGKDHNSFDEYVAIANNTLDASTANEIIMRFKDVKSGKTKYTYDSYLYFMRNGYYPTNEIKRVFDINRNNTNAPSFFPIK